MIRPDPIKKYYIICFSWGWEVVTSLNTTLYIWIKVNIYFWVQKMSLIFFCLASNAKWISNVNVKHRLFFLFFFHAVLSNIIIFYFYRSTVLSIGSGLKHAARKPFQCGRPAMNNIYFFKNFDFFFFPKYFIFDIHIR